MKRKQIKKVFRSDLLFDICVNLIATLVILIVLVPLLFVLAASFSDPDLVILSLIHILCRN